MMLQHEFLQNEGILVVKPESPLTKEDFATIAAIVDPYIEAHGKLHGLMIYANSFPGWENFGGLVSHMKFVRDHHRYVERIAAVTAAVF